MIRPGLVLSLLPLPIVLALAFALEAHAELPSGLPRAGLAPAILQLESGRGFIADLTIEDGNQVLNGRLIVHPSGAVFVEQLPVAERIWIEGALRELLFPPSSNHRPLRSRSWNDRRLLGTEESRVTASIIQNGLELPSRLLLSPPRANGLSLPRRLLLANHVPLPSPWHFATRKN